MNGKIVRFETNEMRFLRLATEILSKVKKSICKDESVNLYLNELENLILGYIDCLPPYYTELLDFLYSVIRNEDNNDIVLQKVNDSLRICELMSKTPTLDSYIQIAIGNFDFLYDYPKFDEKILMLVIEFLCCIQSPTYYGKFSSILDKYHLTYDDICLLWLGLAKVSTNECVQYEAIKHLPLDSFAFVEFCKEMADSSNSNEKVLLALINKVSSKKIFSSFSQDSKAKFEIYNIILLCTNPSSKVIQRIIEVIIPSNSLYFNFFHMLIQEYIKFLPDSEKQTILFTIKKKLEIDERLRRGTLNFSFDSQKIKLLINNL